MMTKSPTPLQQLEAQRWSNGDGHLNGTALVSRLYQLGVYESPRAAADAMHASRVGDVIKVGVGLYQRLADTE